MVDGPSTRQLWRPIEGIDMHVNAMKAMGVGA